MKSRPITAVSAPDLVVVDMFCGAGGITTGLVQACKELGMQPKIIAINHWDIAIATHKRNHPEATHWCERVDSLDPRKLASNGRIDFLIAAPECTHHSVARGGKPINDQSRASAWQVVRYAEALLPRHILLENVREFANWGPLCANNKRPLKSKRGQTFVAFLAALESLGYTVGWKILNSADYGEATTRERLFIQAKRGRGSILWPSPTHTRDAEQAGLFGDLKPWRPAREIIDWSLRSRSIFSRRKPLAPATMKRIEAGLRKFGGKRAEPFLVVLRNHQNAKSVNEPIPTITTSGAHVGLCEAFVLGQQSGSSARCVRKPLPTVSPAGAIALVEPFIIAHQRRGNQPTTVDNPMQTLTATSSDFALVEPFITPLNHGMSDHRHYSLGNPLPTITSADTWAVVEPSITAASHENGGTDQRGGANASLATVTGSDDNVAAEPFLIPFFGERERQEPRSHSVEEPLPTVTSHGAGALVEPFLVPVHHGESDQRSYPVGEPIPAITTFDAWSIVETFLCKYNRTAKHGQSIDEPLDSVTAKDRFGLVVATASGHYQIDIRFRMLQPRELAAAMGFEEYQFVGNREQQVKQIGNAVSVRTARALCLAILPRFLKGSDLAGEGPVA
jgi:DNA (cytosine-5)-methyltransferase 1